MRISKNDNPTIPRGKTPRKTGGVEPQPNDKGQAVVRLLGDNKPDGEPEYQRDIDIRCLDCSTGDDDVYFIIKKWDYGDPVLQCPKCQHKIEVGVA